MMLSKKFWIGEIYCQFICHKYIFDLKWWNSIMISSKSMIQRWLRKVNNRLKYRQLQNGIFTTQYHFLTYWVWVLVQKKFIWHSRRWNMYPRRQKIPISSWTYVFSVLKKNMTHSRLKLTEFCLRNLMLWCHNKWGVKLTTPMHL